MSTRRIPPTVGVRQALAPYRGPGKWPQRSAADEGGACSACEAVRRISSMSFVRSASLGPPQRASYPTISRNGVDVV